VLGIMRTKNKFVNCIVNYNKREGENLAHMLALYTLQEPNRIWIWIQDPYGLWARIYFDIIC
jgi:hypothetical protein